MKERKKVTPQSVDYRQATTSRCCGNCTMYRGAPAQPTIGTCDLVLGKISSKYVCDKWQGR